jgi:hypothetical protein
MSETRYLIVGGGMTGHAAAAAIREADPDGAISMISAEADRPYARPPLSKGLWLGKPEESVWLSEVPGLVFQAGRRAVALDLRARDVRDDRGEVHGYDKLLLATGGVPRRLPFGGDRVLYFRTLADYRRLRAVEGRRVTIIGGGFIGSEIAASLAANGKEVTMIFPEAAVGARAYPAELAAFVTGYFTKKGVRVLAARPSPPWSRAARRPWCARAGAKRSRPTPSWRGWASGRRSPSQWAPGSVARTGSRWTRCSRRARPACSPRAMSRGSRARRSASGSGSSTRTRR